MKKNPLGIVVKSCVAVNENPNMADFKGHHWQVTLYNPRNRRRMSVYFSMGYGHNGKEPTADDVLSCVSGDSDCADYSSFEEWADEHGYDTDSRKAERTYNTCIKEGRKLAQFINSNEDMEALREWAQEY